MAQGHPAAAAAELSQSHGEGGGGHSERNFQEVGPHGCSILNGYMFYFLSIRVSTEKEMDSSFFACHSGQSSFSLIAAEKLK